MTQDTPYQRGAAVADRSERTIHRLEAFSDIVIAFCLAELGLNLVIPKDEAGLGSLWLGLNAFAFSFVLIAVLWWYHHKLFETYLRLNAATVIMNFILLATLIFAVYFAQVAIHFELGNVDATVPLRLWLACMALIYALLTGMYVISVWERRRELDASSMRWAVSFIYQAALGSIGLAILCFMIPHNTTGTLATVLIVGVASALQGPVASRLAKNVR